VSVDIRAMRAEDVDRVLALAADPEAPQWSRLDYERILRADSSDPLQRCGLVALSDGSVSGFAIASWLHQETAAEVEGLFVGRTHRRQGTGGGLVRACMAWAAGTGASAIRLEVRASNAAALALYQRFGFAAVGIRHAYYSVPVEDAVLLEAPLPL
jgi:ribosomal-protein-alanine N-acetyltransferase